MKSYKFSELKNEIIAYIEILANNHEKAVEHESEHSTKTLDSDLKALHKKHRLRAINRLLVSTLKLFSFNIDNPNYKFVADMNSDGKITVDLSMANTKEEKELLTSFIDAHKSDIQIFKNKEIKPHEACPFYYLRYYEWLKYKAMKFILEEKEGEGRRKTALAYISVVGIYGDFVNNKNKKRWDGDINVQLIESIESLENNRFEDQKTPLPSDEKKVVFDE